MMVGNNLKDTQLQQIVDKTILFADKDEDGKISFEEFCAVSQHLIYVFLFKRMEVETSIVTSYFPYSGGWEYGRAQKDGC